MKPGDVFFDKEFHFSDGETGEKLFVLLNLPKADGDPFLVLKTTSQSRRYDGITRGCNPPRFVFFLTKAYYQDSFPLDTYIQMDEIFEYTSLQFIKGGFNKVLEKKHTLKEQTFRELINCLKRLKDDISVRHYRILFK